MREDGLKSWQTVCVGQDGGWSGGQCPPRGTPQCEAQVGRAPQHLLAGRGLPGNRTQGHHASPV